MSSYRVARRYAAALLMLAQERNVTENVASDAQAVLQLGKASAPFRNLLRSPIIYRDKKQRILRLIFRTQLNELTLRFIDILLRKRREQYMLEVFDAYLQLYKAERKIAEVMVYLPFGRAEKLLESFKQWVTTLPPLRDAKVLQLHSTVDERLIGGFIIEFEGYKLDQSVRTQLDSLRKTLVDS